MSCFILVVLFFVAAFYCRDPDTGKFYPVNATWSSTTFCGSYTCKIRKLNYTTQSSSLREINITDTGAELSGNESATLILLPLSGNETAILKLLPVNRTNGTVSSLSVAQDYNKTTTDFPEQESSTSPRSTTSGYVTVQNSSKENAKEKFTHMKKKLEKLEFTQNDKIGNADNETTLKTIQNDTQEHLGNVTHSKNIEILYNAPAVLTQKEGENNTMVHENLQESKITNQTVQKNVSVSKDDDRYLTRDEINALTSLLQNVKKSDVEAILEVYNLAQDIYKEIDKNADHGVTNEIQNIQSKRRNSKPEEPIKRQPNDHISYWYEPLSHSNNKQKVVQIDASKLVPVLPPNPKKETHTIPVPPIVMKKAKEEDTIFEGTTKINDALPPNYSYFMGPLANSNFRKLPYYYPMLGIHKQGNYIPGQEYFEQLAELPGKISSHKSSAKTAGHPGLNAELPVTKKNFIKMPCKQEHFKQTTGEEIFTKKTTMNKDKISFMDNPKNLLAPFTHMYKKTPTVLPYPFAYVHYNLSSLPNTYFNANPFHLFNIRPQEPLNKKMPPQPYVNPKYVPDLPNAILINPDLSEGVDIIEQKPVEVILTQEDKLPAWQTAPLSQNVLNEVKANVIAQSKLLPLPIRKKVKLERVSKVIKMDELKRSIRDTMKRELELEKEEPAEFEVYLEKST